MLVNSFMMYFVENVSVSMNSVIKTCLHSIVNEKILTINQQPVINKRKEFTEHTAINKPKLFLLSSKTLF